MLTSENQIPGWLNVASIRKELKQKIHRKRRKNVKKYNLRIFSLIYIKCLRIKNDEDNENVEKR